jgi:serine/threonine protein kinase
MMAHQTKKAEPIQKFNPEVPDEIVEIIERMMQKQPNARYPNMTDVAAAIKPFVREFENSMPTTSRTPPIEKKQSRANLIPTTTANRISPPLPDRPEPDLPLSSAQFATPELTSDPMPTMPQAQRPQSGRLVMPTRAAVVAPPVHAPTPVAAPAPPPTLTPAPVPGRGRNQAPAKKSQEGKRKRYSAAQSLEERLGTIGLLVICLLLGAVVWIAYSMLVK